MTDNQDRGHDQESEQNGDQRDRNGAEPDVVNLQQRGEVDWLAANRRDDVCICETGDAVQTPDGEGTVVARFIHEQSIGGREFVASRESPTYVVQLPDSEPPHPSYDEAEITVVED
jgi:hypothetical protein